VGVERPLDPGVEHNVRPIVDIIYIYHINELDNELHMSSRPIESENEVALQRKVEELERSVKTWEIRYLGMEQDRNIINEGYRMVADQKNELEMQKKELEMQKNALKTIQANNNAEIITLRGEIGRLNREVEWLKTQNKKLQKNSSNSSSGWSFFGKRKNMQTLLEDLNNLQDGSSLNMS